MKAAPGMKGHCTRSEFAKLAHMISVILSMLLCCGLVAVEPITQRTVADNGDVVLTTTTLTDRGEVKSVQTFSAEGILKARRNPDGVTRLYWADREGRITKCTWDEGGRHHSIEVAYGGDDIIAFVDELGNRADVRGLGFSWKEGELVREDKSPIH